MSDRLSVTIDNYDRFNRESKEVELGHYFAYSHSQDVSLGGKRARLQGSLSDSPLSVIALVDEEVEIAGALINCVKPQFGPLATVITDRDLYKAHEDTINLFICAPDMPLDLELVIERDGQPFTERRLDLQHEGVALEYLPGLFPGNYQASLKSPKGPIGKQTSFTVAEYTLAPLSAKLTHHELKKDNILTTQFEVESYQVPFNSELVITVLENNLPKYSHTFEAIEPGKFRCQFLLEGDGPFSFELQAKDDSGKVAQVALPGSHRFEMETTIINELGTQVGFSLMPTPKAIPARGGFLSEGEKIDVPISSNGVTVEQAVLTAHLDLESLVLIVADLVSGEIKVEQVGDVAAGKTMKFDLESSLCTIIAGCFVNQKPFEGYTTFFRQQCLDLNLSAPAKAACQETINLTVDISGVDKKVPVLLSIRDRRLTQSAAPKTGLASNLKQEIDAVIECFKDESGFVSLESCAQRFSFDPSLMDFDYMDSSPVFVAGSDSSVDTEVCLDAGDSQAIYRQSLQLDDFAEPEYLASEPALCREIFPQVVFFDLIWVNKKETIEIELSDALTTYSIEAFALCDGDWVAKDKTLTVDQPVRVDLDLPLYVHPNDRATGTIHAAVSKGKMRVELFRDGERDQLFDDLASPASLTIEATAGVYEASVTELSTGNTDKTRAQVDVPGRFQTQVRELALLSEGELVDLDPDIISLRILPGIDEPFKELVEATGDYCHLCCEQTAAKIISATTMYMLTDSRLKKLKAEQIVITGIEREKSMWKKGKGFFMYPEHRQINEYYSKLAAGYLWNLKNVGEITGLSIQFKSAINEGISMAMDVMKAHKIAPIASKIVDASDAYCIVRESQNHRFKEVRDYLDRNFPGGLHLKKKEKKGLLETFWGTNDEIPPWDDPVSQRYEAAYAAAAYLAMGDLPKGIALASTVTKSINEGGMLYSTVDSVAAIALMNQIQKLGLNGGDTRVNVNGETMSAQEATSFGNQIESVCCEKGIALVEKTRILEDRWDSLESNFPINVNFVNEDGKKISKFIPGDRIYLSITLIKGYRFGDILHVCLPPVLSWIHGGGRIKKFCMDFQGKDFLRIPLVVTGKQKNKEHFALCVRNMFEEQRVSSPGWLTAN